MTIDTPNLNPDIVRMLVLSMTQDGKTPLTEIQVERFLNSLTRAQFGVPTGINNNVIDQKTTS